MLKAALTAVCALTCGAGPSAAEPSVWNLVGSSPWIQQDGHYRSNEPRRTLTLPGKPYRCAIAVDKVVCIDISDDARAVPGTEREAR